MRTLRARVIAVVCVAFVFVVPAAQAQAPSTRPAGPSPTPKPVITAASAILVNLSDDSQVTFTRAARVVRAPASLTKIVTALVVRDEFALDDVVVASPLVLQTSGSDLGLEPGMKLSVRELLYGLLLKSANDSAMALAAHDPAGYEHFIALMNQKARALGAYDSTFRNPHGLDQVGHQSSARDMAIFTRELMRDRTLAAISGTPRHTLIWKGQSRTYAHHHKLLLRNNNIKAGKTAFTNLAGHALMTVADTPAGRLIAVVMGSQDQYADTEWLFVYGKNVAARQASGGGSVRGFGPLQAPPSPPDNAFAQALPVDRNDPRDDIRWSILMMVLAGLTALTLITSRRRADESSGVEAWLAGLAAPDSKQTPHSR